MSVPRTRPSDVAPFAEASADRSRVRSPFGIRPAATAALLGGLLTVGVLAGAGCGSPAPTFHADRAYLAKQERELGTEEQPFTFTASQVADVDRLVVSFFGTPDDPRVPVLDDLDGAELLDLDKLRLAAGAVSSDENGVEVGLYRKNCAHCHGITGDGRGPTSAYLNPYPRDFRSGIVKWKSTPRGERPTHDDLVRILNDGVPGTSMPSFKLLNEAEIDALVEYVRYLSLRGEFERRLILLLANTDEGEPLVAWPDDTAPGDPDANSAEPNSAETDGQESATASRAAAASSDEASKADTPQVAEGGLVRRPAAVPDAVLAQGLQTNLAEADFEALVEASERWEDVYELVEEVFQRWNRAEGRATNVPAPPDWMRTPDGRTAAISRGRQIFHGAVASCVRCHGTLGQGDGQVNDFDDWTKEYHIPERGQSAPETYAQYQAAYKLLPARNILPRNLRTGVYRGGRRPIDLYWRLVNGIDGSPMPAVPVRPDDAPPGTVGLTSEEVWCLIEYVMSLPREAINNPYIQAGEVAQTAR